MAKKAQAENIEVAPQEVAVKTAPKQEVKPAKPSWEIKDRVYYLRNNKSPLTLTIPSRHTKKHSLLYFDLQKLLSLYHPLKGKMYEEFSAVEEAEDDLDILDLQIDALNAARNMDIDQSEAILRVELGSKVNNMSSKEIKRDILLFARNNPQLFISLANDENVQLRNVAIRAAEAGIINLSPDQRTFTWGSNGRKLMNVPFDENPYSAFAAFLKTDEGVEIYKSIDKKL